MRIVMVVMISAAMSLLVSCSTSTEQGSEAQPIGLGQSQLIRTEKELNIFLQSIKAGETWKNVMLVGKLDLGSNPKLDPSKLIIGKTAVNFGHDLDKAKYNGQNVLIKADIVHNAEGKTDAQLWGHTIVNVQQIEIMKQP